MSKGDDPGYPYGEFDAMEWAKEFVRIFPDAGVDVELMHGWFANAIMTGYDLAYNKTREYNPVRGHDYD